jgi:hypothetical protein
MEELIFAMIALSKAYTRRETFVPEPDGFQSFDVRSLKRSYEAAFDSSSRPDDRKKSLVTQIAS